MYVLVLGGIGLNKVNPLTKLERGTIGNYIARFEDNKLYSSFYLKEDLANIDYLLNKATLEMKAIPIKANGQPFVTLLFKFGDSNNYIYGRLYNTLNKNDKEHLEILLFQGELPISFVDLDNNIVRTVMVENDFKDYIKRVFITKNIKSIKTSKNYEDEYNLKELWMEIQ
jgi:hypothetical protein